MQSKTAFFKKLTISKKLLLLLTPIITLFLNMKISIIALFILIFIDLITGIRKSHNKNNIKFNPFKKEFWVGKKPPIEVIDVERENQDSKIAIIKSNGGVRSYLLRQTWKKTYEYIFGIVAIAILEVYMLGPTEVEIIGKTNNITRWAIIIAGIIELWSIFENLEAVSGRNPLKRLIGILPGNIKKLFESSNKKQ